MADCSSWNVGLSNLTHGDRRLHPGIDPGFLAEVLQGQAVHHGAEHSHVVCARSVDAPLGQLGTAEVVATADDHGDLDSGSDNVCDLAGNARHHIGINAQLPAPGEGLTRQLE